MYYALLAESILIFLTEIPLELPENGLDTAENGRVLVLAVAGLVLRLEG